MEARGNAQGLRVEQSVGPQQRAGRRPDGFDVFKHALPHCRWRPKQLVPRLPQAARQAPHSQLSMGVWWAGWLGSAARARPPPREGQCMRPDRRGGELPCTRSSASGRHTVRLDGSPEG